MLAKKIKTNLPKVVMVGRTNVGKSTLFNALMGKKKAIVSNIEGTTRDANMGEVSWNRRDFTLIDTGGFIDLGFLTGKKKANGSIDEKVQQQARDFITRADIVLLMVDAKDGLLSDDKKIAKTIKNLVYPSDKLILVANKADSAKLRSEASVFYQLNLGDPQMISAAIGSGTGDLLDLIVDKLKDWEPANKEDAEENKVTEIEESDDKENPSASSGQDNNEIKVCILGKPNVGKSSLLNAILGYERVIVSPVAHTTREPQDTLINYQHKTIRLIDTAGIHKAGMKIGSRKSKLELEKKLEYHGIESTLKILRQADIVTLVVDINDGLTKQDVKLVEAVFENRKSLIILANKWDLVAERDVKKFTKEIYGTIPFAQFAPIHFISAKTKEKVHKVLDEIIKIHANRQLVISPEDLKEFISYCVTRHPPTKGKGQRYPRVRNFKQTGTNPPEFAVKVGSKEYLADSYLGFLSNRLRERYELTGTPIKMWVEKNNISHGRADQ